MPWMLIPTQIQIRQNYADPTNSDPEQQHFNVEHEICVNPSKKKKKEKTGIKMETGKQICH
jgi:hypothetical protein